MAVLILAVIASPAAQATAAKCTITNSRTTETVDGVRMATNDPGTFSIAIAAYNQHDGCNEEIIFPDEFSGGSPFVTMDQMLDSLAYPDYDMVLSYSGIADPIKFGKFSDDDEWWSDPVKISSKSKKILIKADTVGTDSSCLFKFKDDIGPITWDLHKIGIQIGKSGEKNYKSGIRTFCGGANDTWKTKVKVCQEIAIAHVYKDGWKVTHIETKKMDKCQTVAKWEDVQTVVIHEEEVTEDVDGDGYTETDGDCDDHDPAVYPGAPGEISGDGVDQNCDGSDGEYPDSQEDSDFDGYCPSATYTTDSDQNGYCTAEDTAGATADCDDDNADIYPGAVESLDEIDNDCDGTTDEGYTDNDHDCVCGENADAFNYDSACDTDADSDSKPDYVGDGTCDTTESDLAIDCDDQSASASPLLAGQDTAAGDGIDNDCDGSVDEDAAPPPTTPPPTTPTTPTTPPTTEPVDADGDGYTTETDCDDTNAAIYPGNGETVGDGIDNDCDASTSDSATPTETASDSDGDGVPDESDNCPDVANADQVDCNGDGVGFACDEEGDVVDLDDEALAACGISPSESEDEKAPYAGGCSLASDF